MPRMFVANCTQQVQVFMYRLPESNRSFVLDIPIGGQVELSGTSGAPLSSRDVDAIVAHHSTYGMVNIADLDRARPFVGTCYSLDKPIPGTKIEKGVYHNRDVLIERGDEIQRHAAVGVSNKIESEMPGLKGLEVTAVELDNPRKGTTGEFSSAVRVDDQAPRGDPKPFGQRRGKRAA